MKPATFAAVLLSTLLVSSAVLAGPLSFNWEFDLTPTQSGGMSGTVKGTISGLSEGGNSGSGLNIVVTDTPTGEFEGFSDWFFVHSGGFPDAFTVVGGDITFASALFINGPAGYSLYLGGYGGVQTGIESSASGTNWGSADPVRFFAVTDVPEPATLALFGAGLLALGLARRKQAA